MPQDELLQALRVKIDGYGKENQTELLYVLAEGVRLISGVDLVRIYLEDLISGALTCAFATGPDGAELREVAFPIITQDAVVSRVFVSQYPADFRVGDGGAGTLDGAVAGRFNLSSSSYLPLVSRGRSIGVLCIDSRHGDLALSGKIKSRLAEFILQLAERLDEARSYHQQVQLARRLEESKKREAAGQMVRSAVRLVEKVALASVLTPLVSSDGSAALEVLASYAEDPALQMQYDRLGAILLEPGASLISRYVDVQAVIRDDRLLKPLFINDLTRYDLQKRELTEQMSLRSLYVVPRFDPHSHRVICLVNYFCREEYRFSEFEMGLLQGHAEMLASVVSGVGGEHLEIRVLSEITELLNQGDAALQPFLTKVLAKATELIGADTGSIALVEERDGRRWLVVEDEQGTLVGAKNKEWLKRYIPPFPVGGVELSPEERSLTGYVAWSQQPKIIGSVDEERTGEGFHRSMSDLLKSEIAVPVVCDGEVIAVICLNSLRYSYFTEEHRRILQIIGSLTARHLSDLQRIEGLQGEVQRLTTDVGYKDPHVSSYRLGNIIGVSPTSQAVIDFINTVSQPLFNRVTLWSKNVMQEATIGLPSILITGPTGSGKEFFFNNLYNTLNSLYRLQLNPQGELPVKKTNIAAYSGELTYSELFGHKKGAFTGASSDRRGILEECMGGVVFLDEIGDADPKTQVQLLRFLDNGGFVRLGENMERFSRVLLVAATNRDLPAEIAAGRFREDLYHRLAELSIRLPSLNERREDIPDLAVHFLGKLYRTYRGQNDPDDPPVLAADAKSELVLHQYEGNIRELRSILLRAMFFRRGNVIGGESIRQAIKGVGLGSVTSAGDGRELASHLADTIIEKIRQGGNFWQDLYEPFTRNDISRDVVRLVVEKSRAFAGRPLPAVARNLRALTDGMSDDEQRKMLYKFKNFLYKTVRL
ncbi:GPMC system transcriptional regulator [Trichlorobacter lovleyi]|uniref:GPMC system transcriptional regulator n=1 Tax=Trichlorobacter lovleyi TaxID=313985 RepID=UPI0023F4BBD9|nr:GPMC system transcriptional regulator [Trichlorobacter lovleyi]